MWQISDEVLTMAVISYLRMTEIAACAVNALIAVNLLCVRRSATLDDSAAAFVQDVAAERSSAASSAPG